MVKVSKSGLRSIFYLIGPAIIVASVVLGPGSIVTSSKVGCEFGYELLWVLGMSGIMMVSMVMLSAWIGVSHSKSFCTEIAERLGRPLAVAIGVTVFGIVAGFQVSNNVAILLAFEPFFDNGQIPLNYKIGILLVLNLLLIGVLFGLKKIYKPIEKLMMGLVLMMLIGFAVNFFFAGVSISGVLRGILPSIPDGFFENGFFPQISEDNETQKRFVSMPFGAVQGMIATTFSVAGAMYQAYLVKEKGWTLEKIRAGEVDSIFGITILIGISGLILCTAAAVLHGNVAPSELNSATAVANQLRPSFGNAAYFLFCLGIFAGAFSSFLVNAMIGGSVLADSIGKTSSIDGIWTKSFTVSALAFGMVLAIAVSSIENLAVTDIIVYAQALTVIGNPGLAAAILYLGHQAKKEEKPVPSWLFVVGYVGLFVVSALGLRTALSIWLSFTL